MAKPGTAGGAGTVVGTGGGCASSGWATGPSAPGMLRPLFGIEVAVMGGNG